MIAAAARRAGATKLVTFDRAAARIAGVESSGRRVRRPVHPFAGGSCR
jgi:hypothetical protein